MDDVDTTNNMACADIPAPIIEIEKNAGALTFDAGIGANGGYDVEYTVTATNTSADAPSVYSFVDTPIPPSGMSVIAVTAVGTTNTTTTAADTATDSTITNEPIAVNGSDTWTVTVRYQIDTPADVVTGDATCNEATGIASGGFANAVTSATDVDTSNNDACVDVPAPSIEIEKTAGTVTYDSGIGANGAYDVEYTVTATNSSANAPSVYGFVDTPTAPAGMSVVSVAAVGDGTTTTSAIDAATTSTVDNEPIAASGVEEWVVTVRYEVDVPADVITGAATCNETTGVASNGFANMIASNDDGTIDNNDACVDVPDPVIELTKTVGTPIDNADGTWTVEYTVLATNTGTGPGSYDVIEDFMPGTGITLSSAVVAYIAGTDTDNSGTITSPLAADGTAVSGEVLSGGLSESFTITATYAVDGALVTANSMDCTDDAGENGETGFANSISGSSTETDATDNAACAPLPGAVIELTKSVGTPVDNGDGTWTVEYTVLASNTGAGPGSYDVIEDFMPGTGITLDSAAVAYLAGTETDNSGTITTPLTADGTAVAGEMLLGGMNESFTITATYAVDGALVTTTSMDCTDDAGENGETGFANSISGSSTETDATDNAACAVLPPAVIELTKTVGTPIDNGNSTWTVEYSVQATNNGAGPGSYDVIEDFMPGTGITLNSAVVAYVAGTETDNSGTITTPLSADGTAVAAEMLLGGLSEGFTITATYAVDSTLVSVASMNCTDDAFEAGNTGFANSISGSATETDATDNTACAPLMLAQLQLTKSVTDVTVVNGVNDQITDADDVISYGFSVTNTGNLALSPVTITDPKIGLTNAVCSTTAATLAVGATVACDAITTATYTILQTDVEAGGIENVAVATGTPVDNTGNPIDDPSNPGNPLPPVIDVSDTGTDDAGDPINDPQITNTDNPLGENPNDPGDPTDDPTTLMLTPVPSLALIKSVSSVTDTNANGFTDEGDVVNYSFTVENTGSTALAPVTLVDTLATLSPDATCTASLAIGQTAVCANTASYSLTQADIDAGGIENVATATGVPVDVNGDPLDDPANPGTPIPSVVDKSDTGTDGNGDPVADSGLNETPGVIDTNDGDNGDDSNNDGNPGNDATPLAITPTPQLALVKSSGVVTDVNGNGFTDTGDTIEYSFEVFNTGNVNLLLATTITDAVLTGSVPSVSVTCPADTVVAPRASSTACVASLPYTITQDDVDAGGVENSADIDASPVQSDGVTPIDDPANPGNPLDDVNDISDTGTDTTGGPVTDPQDNETPDIDGVNGDNNDAIPGNDVTPVAITPVALLQLTKSVTDVTVLNGANDQIVDAQDVITYGFSVRNTGNVALSPVTITDAKIGLLDAVCSTTTSTLAVGATVACDAITAASYTIMQTDVEVGGVENVAIASGEPVTSLGTPIIDSSGIPLPPVTDISDTGTDPAGDPINNPQIMETPNPLDENPNSPGDPSDDPTTLMLTPMPSIELIKSITSVTDTNGNGFTDEGDTVEYSFSVTNTGSTTLAPVTFSDARLNLSNVACVSSLAVGATEVCSTVGTYSIEETDILAGGVENTAIAAGTPVDGNGAVLNDPVTGNPLSPVTDNSDSGVEPVDASGINPSITAVIDPGNEETDDIDSVDGNSNDNDPGNDVTSVILTAVPEIGVVKSAEVGPLLGDGTIDVTYTVVVENTGNISLSPLTLVDQLAAVDQLGSAFNGVTAAGQPVVSGVTINSGSVVPTTNGAAFIGETPADSDLITGTDGTLIPGDSYQVVFIVNVDPNADQAPAALLNTATGSGLPPGSDTPVVDDSNTGTDPNGDPTGEEPTNNPGGPGVPTEVTPPTIDPSLIVSKFLAGPPVDLGGGVFRVTFDMVIVNDGNVDFTNLQLEDDLVAMTNNPIPSGATVSNASVSYVSGTVVTPNSTYTGTGQNNMLAGTDSFAVGASSTVALSFDFTPASYFGPFNNVSLVSGEDPLGVTEIDNSENSVQPVPTNGGGDFRSETPFRLSVPSTPITLGWIRTTDNLNGSMLIEWQTETEVSNAGFYFMTLLDDGSWSRVNDEMIVSQGDSTTAQNYQYLAPLVGSQIMLIDVSIMGKEVEHGPFELDQEEGYRSQPESIDWNSINQESDGKEMRREQQRQQQLQDRLQGLQSSSNPATNSRKLSFLEQVFAAVLTALVPTAQAVELLSFEVDSPGIYQVTHQSLLAKGLDLRGVDVSRIGLKEGSVLWPMHIDSSGSSTFTEASKLQFPARGLDTLYAGTNKYILVLDEGQKSILHDDTEVPGSGVALASSYLGEKTYSPQNFYSFTSPESGDSWYADALNRVNSEAAKSVDLSVDDYTPAVSFGFGFGSNLLRQPVQNPQLEVSLWGGSALPGNGVDDPDHHVRISLNNELVSEVRFDGLRAELDITELSGIINGVNSVDLVVPNESGYLYDLVRLDHVTLRYPRKFEAQGSALVFDSSWNKFRVKGLSGNDAKVVRLDNAGDAYFMTARGSGSCDDGCVYFAGSDANQEDSYFVATSAGLKIPTIGVAVDDSGLSAQAAKFVIISHPDFIGTNNQLLEGYAAEIEEKYESVEIVDVETIYAAYSGGVTDAYAISEYLRDAYYDKGTRHVMLVGGDVYDYRDYTGTGARSFIPSVYAPIAVNVNSVPSDSSYVLIDDDLVPDMTITRLPVRTTADLTNLIAKRTSYLARSYGGKAVFAADELDASNYSFKSDSQRLIFDHFSDWDVDEVYLDDTTPEGASATISNAINDGVALASYFGHSSADRWSISSMLSGDDVASLSNVESPTVVAQWGCWNTFYVSPENDSMAHRFLLEGQQGAVTVMGASSFTQADAERRMAGHLFANFKQGMSIGDAVKSAKEKIAVDTPYQIDVLLGWTVLGFDDMPVFE